MFPDCDLARASNQGDGPSRPDYRQKYPRHEGRGRKTVWKQNSNASSAGKFREDQCRKDTVIRPRSNARPNNLPMFGKQPDFRSLLPGRGRGTRTHDPRFWRPMLYQLSYTPSGSEPSTGKAERTQGARCFPCRNFSRHPHSPQQMQASSRAAGHQIWWGEEKLERVKGIEPSYSAWKAAALPLSYTRPGCAPAYSG